MNEKMNVSFYHSYKPLFLELNSLKCDDYYLFILAAYYVYNLQLLFVILKII